MRTATTFCVAPSPGSTRLTAGSRPLTPSRRAGFSLTELLVVIAIIALLISTAYVIFGDAFGSAKRAATQATIKKVDELLTTRIDAFNRWMRDQSTSNIELAGNDRGLAGTDKNLAQILGRKEYFRRYFPQMFSEGDFGLSGGATHNPITESSEVLYFMLTKAEAFGIEPISADVFTTNEVADTDNDGLKEFVDGWGRPLRFYRWPTRLIRQNNYVTGAVPDSQYAKYLIDSKSLYTPDGTTLNLMEAQKDPDDQIGAIQLIVDDPMGVFSVAMFEQNYHSPATYHAPLIVSAGFDGLLGLYEPADITNKGYLAAPTGSEEELKDNISNLNQRAGSGKKK